MATICSKHKQRSEADSVSKIGRAGTLKDDLTFHRCAPYPLKGEKNSGGDMSIVLGSREPGDGRFNTIKSMTYVKQPQVGPLSKDHVLYMRDKHFQFSNDPPTAEEAMTTENRGTLLAPPKELLSQRLGKKEIQRKLNIYGS
eukprot:PhF_6_TR3403/c0_g1_i1/m.4897